MSGTKTASEEKIQSGKSWFSDVYEQEKEVCNVGEEASGQHIFDTECLASAIEQAAVCKACKQGALML